MDAKRITYHAHQIKKCYAEGNYGNIIPHLTALDYGSVTLQHLEDTDIMKVLYGLLKNCPDTSIKKTVKQLLSKWKKLYSHPYRISKENIKEEFTVIGESTLTDKACLTDSREVAAGDSSKPAELRASCEHVSSNTGSRQGRTPTSGKDPVKDIGEGVSSSCQVTGDSPSGSGLSIPSNDFGAPAPISEGSTPSCKHSAESALRSQCTRLLHGALDPETTEGRSAVLAHVIEEHIHAFQCGNQVKYKACIRSKVSNLRNPKNGHLRQGLLGGSLAPEVFARMSADEMAGEELQRLREEYSLQGVRERQLPQGVEGTPTRKLRCSRCEASDCRVTQVSRGALFLPAWVRQATADQDAMTFVTCSGCGEQWYHSGWNCL
ncbi:transcription elongation factor A N-terminal and central domain-containing protein [Esox lucius]|nr:transcription elongation factor A N-terminal and central domain-containing protein [Esox lucius]XP_010884952.2 transcription elongation factor A N-terminal and central domain-containing protein [Esox lucius]XP_019898092.2 transcription elongation factor A N-terminal and central domain-containing protein [Esox lucius]XP_019898093.2 transcription elongation factor A N-terminal and central domain-containing protein [Esox lucius]XP_019898094.2 transcription elongation factor A N-terminal and cen